MADEPLAPESATPVESTPVATTPESTTPATPEQAPLPSFGENLKAAVTTAAPQTFTQADFDARLKTEQETWQKAQDEKYAWANGLNPQEVQSWREAIDGARANPVETATQLLAAALATPEHKQAALSFAARLLNGTVQRGSAPALQSPVADEEPGPDIPATTADGRTIYLYSAEQLAKREAWKDRQLDKKLTERFKPFEDDRAQTAEQREAAAQQKAHVDFAVDVYTRVSKFPHFEENRDAIAAAWEKMPGNLDPLTAERNLNAAYVQVVTNKLQANSSAAAATDAARRAAASTGRVTNSQPSQVSAPEKVGMAEGIARAMAAARRA